MAKDKEFEARMQGMRYAYEIAQKDGLDGLEKEIKRRGITKLPFTVSQSEAQQVWNELSSNMYVNVAMTFLSTLKNEFGFTKEQLQELKVKYDETVKASLDVDYMGEHYVKLEDYAVELNSECGLDLDIARIASCQDYYDESSKDSNYHRVKVERIVTELKNNGYEEAATYLEGKLG